MKNITDKQLLTNKIKARIKVKERGLIRVKKIFSGEIAKIEKSIRLEKLQLSSLTKTK